MPASIVVRTLERNTFQATVKEGRSQSSHTVTLTPEYHQKLTGGKISAEELVRQSFEFLLERESKESILTEFDLPIIGRYFPEYEGEIKRRVEA
ncbi:MAG: hypothetical protein ACRD2O_10440 [Terriglobia bacterium]